MTFFSSRGVECADLGMIRSSVGHRIPGVEAGEAVGSSASRSKERAEWGEAMEASEDEVRVMLQRASFGERERAVVSASGSTASLFRYDTGVDAIRLSSVRSDVVVLPYMGQMVWSAAFDGVPIHTIRWILDNTDQRVAAFAMPATREPGGYTAEKQKGNVRVLASGATAPFVTRVGYVDKEHAASTAARIEGLRR
jgi:hypothetical protein